ncbi:MAG TPA: HAMP domain-containing sensor histidine kinase [Acidimicrobiales bacterium]|nr:HAMP domain-containing sensor histidine kinase [Acidimicrobiales bacterium]
MTSHDAAGAAGGSGLSAPQPGEVIATVSHELRQPLASIRGFTEMLLAHWTDFSEPEKLEMLRGILHDTERVARLVDDLLGSSGFGPAQLAVHCRPIDLTEVLARVRADFLLSWPAVEISARVPPRRWVVLADPFRLEQVLTNIIENSCTHGGASRVSVTVSRLGRGSALAHRLAGAPPRDELRGPGGPPNAVGSPADDDANLMPTGGQGGSPAEAGWAVVRVDDDGRGIHPDELPHVTEKFFRSTRTTARGLGLGLWLSKEIVEAHGGRLLASSVVGKGATVCFTLPLAGAAHGTPLRGATGTGKLAGT